MGVYTHMDSYLANIAKHQPSGLIYNLSWIGMNGAGVVNFHMCNPQT